MLYMTPARSTLDSVNLFARKLSTTVAQTNFCTLCLEFRFFILGKKISVNDSEIGTTKAHCLSVNKHMDKVHNVNI
jgi:hypothetical protein